MNNKDIETRLKSEIEAATPDVFQKIIEGVNQSETSATVITFQQKSKKRPVVKTLSAIAAALAVALIGSYMWFFTGSDATFDVEFDVNPGVILSIDENEKVSDVKLLNEDAEIVLDSMELEGSDLNVAVNALMYSIIKNGYIDEMTNSVLVTVSDSEGISRADITQRITENVNATLEESSIEGSVLVQSMDKTAALQQIADTYNITIGKAGLIKHLIDSGKTVYTYEQLSMLSINELNILMNEHDALSNITVTGSASRKAYIGETAARNIAYSAFNVAENDVKHVDCILELDGGELIYEVEFILAGALYECEVDALTGKLVDCDIQLAKGDDGSYEIPTSSASTTVSLKTKEEILAFILSSLSLNVADCRNLEISLDYDEGIAKYEVDFSVKDTKYSYEVNAFDGSVIESSFETITTAPPTTTTAPVTEPATKETTTAASKPAVTTSAESQTTAKADSTANLIGNEKAKEIAFAHLGIDAESASDIDVEFGYNSGVVYCVEFKYDNYEYEYEINAHTGEVVDFEKEFDD